jgi:hypothetical protein
MTSSEPKRGSSPHPIALGAADRFAIRRQIGRRVGYSTYSISYIAYTSRTVTDSRGLFAIHRVVFRAVAVSDVTPETGETPVTEVTMDQGRPEPACR